MRLEVRSRYRYGCRVPNQPKTPSRSVRVDDADWAELGMIAEQLGTARGKIIVELIRWYLGRPGAELPERLGDRAKERGRTVQIDAAIWERLPADLADPYTSRAELVNRVLAWYLHKPPDAIRLPDADPDERTE